MTVTIAELTRAFARIGILSFGGPAAQIALMHRDLVEERKWISEHDYLSALSFCMLLPGPEAMQLATWIGWRKQGTRGGLIAGGLFVLPGAIIVLALSMIYAAFGNVPLVAAIITGVQTAVLAIVVEALLRVSRRALKSQSQRVVAAFAFAALFIFAAPFPAVIVAAALWGALVTPRGQTPPASPPAPIAATAHAVIIWGALWLVPLAALNLLCPGILAEIALFFSKLSLLTFGGAYAVLTWMAQEVVSQNQWLTAKEMMDGLGLAETTPGPLILVTQFVGFLAAYREGGFALGVAGAAITLWMTFIPCFLWIFAGAPWINRLTSAPRLAAALRAITAAVVGVIANLSLWFAAHVIFATVGTVAIGPLRMIAPDLSSFQMLPTALACLAAYLLLWRHWPLALVLTLTAAASAAVAAF